MWPQVGLPLHAPSSEGEKLTEPGSRRGRLRMEEMTGQPIRRHSGDAGARKHEASVTNDTIGYHGIGGLKLHVLARLTTCFCGSREGISISSCFQETVWELRNSHKFEKYTRPNSHCLTVHHHQPSQGTDGGRPRLVSVNRPTPLARPA